jgi:hypothetical protein
MGTNEGSSPFNLTINIEITQPPQGLIPKIQPPIQSEVNFDYRPPLCNYICYMTWAPVNYGFINPKMAPANFGLQNQQMAPLNFGFIN